MSIILDILAIATIVGCIISSFKNGALATFIKRLAPVISFIVAGTAAKQIGPNFIGVAAKLVPDAAPVQEIISYAIGFLVVFIVSMIVLYIVAWLFKLLNKVVNSIPVVNVINKVICIALGAFIGYFSANFLVTLIQLIGGFSESIELAFLDTTVCKFISEHSIYGWVAETVAKLIT